MRARVIKDGTREAWLDRMPNAVGASSSIFTALIGSRSPLTGGAGRPLPLFAQRGI
jgi:hypothetical protein